MRYVRYVPTLGVAMLLGVPRVDAQLPPAPRWDAAALESAALAVAETRSPAPGVRVRVGTAFVGVQAGRPLAARAPEAWAQGDPADSLYRRARAALNEGAWRRAAQLFRQLRGRYPRSAYAADAYYYQAFALYRLDGADDLRTARRLLDEQGRRHPRAATRGEAELLVARIQGVLAQRGDAEAAEAVAATAATLAPPAAPVPPSPPLSPAAVTPPARVQQDDIRMAALNALLQMDSERALPILREVLQRRDAGSVELRRQAVFLVSQKRGPEVERILLDVARNDPDAEVRANAVFWLSQVPTDEAAAALDSMLQRSSDREVQEKAVFALSQHRSERAGRALRAFVERSDAPEDLRAKAIFWLGQHRSEENQAFLRQLYPRLASGELKERVLFSVAQRKSTENQRWLMDRALDQSESLELRKKALFWAGQTGAVPIADLVRLYDTMSNREMKEQLVFVYSQRREPEAVDKLMAIARNDPDAELRRKAIFWLGQSKDPRVAQFLVEIINRP